jgi:hypothetical protein
MEHGKAGAGNDMKSSQTEKSPGATGGQRAEDTKGGTKDMKNGQRADESKSGGKDMKAEGREGRDNMKAEGQGRDNEKNAQNRDRDRDRDQNAQNRDRDRDRDQNAQNRDRNGMEKSQTTGQAGASAKLSTDQRTKITSVIHNQHVQSVDKVNFSISVGTRVPREGVRFSPLPAEVVTIHPEWRGFQFIVVREQIVVIDPNTYEIVEVI